MENTSKHYNELYLHSPNTRLAHADDNERTS